MKEVWKDTKFRLPNNGQVVETLHGKNIVKLVRKDNLWFFPDMSMYVYYTPEYWREL